MSNLTRRLTPMEIIERAEEYEAQWLRWALFWMLIGALSGSAATLLLLQILKAR